MSPEDVARNRTRYDQAFALLEEERARVVALLGTVTQAQADRRPAESEWSVGEIADHLAITEQDIMGKVANLAINGKPHEYDYAEVMKKRPFPIENSWDVAISGKAGHPPHLTPTPEKPLPDLLRGLREVRGRTRELLAPFRDQDLGVKFFLHARLGPMTLYERLAFTAYHDRKHLKQMERALARLAA